MSTCFGVGIFFSLGLVRSIKLSSDRWHGHGRAQQATGTRLILSLTSDVSGGRGQRAGAGTRVPYNYNINASIN